MSSADLTWGQVLAIVGGLLFVLAEQFRLKSWKHAAIEGARIWGFMAISILTIWLAFLARDRELVIGIGLISPIVAALIVNNSYLALRRFVDKA